MSVADSIQHAGVLSKLDDGGVVCRQSYAFAQNGANPNQFIAIEPGPLLRCWARRVHELVGICKHFTHALTNVVRARVLAFHSKTRFVCYRIRFARRTSR